MRELREQPVQDFAGCLRSYRKSQGWSQSELAECWSYSFETISSWERGKRFPSRTEMPRIAGFLQMSLQELTVLIAAGKGTPPRQAFPPLASRTPAASRGQRTQMHSPFPQGCLLWTLHLGWEAEGLKCIASCPLDNGETQEIAIDALSEGGLLRQLCSALLDHLIFASRGEEHFAMAGEGKVIALR